MVDIAITDVKQIAKVSPVSLELGETCAAFDVVQLSGAKFVRSDATDDLLGAPTHILLQGGADTEQVVALPLTNGPKLEPTISPNKTWAGLIGGVVAAALVGLAMHVAYGLPLRLTLATPILAVLAQAGDLYESHLKRRAGVKDSGSIIPGHGGVLDRLDGLVPVAPVAALLVVLPALLAA